MEDSAFWLILANIWLAVGLNDENGALAVAVAVIMFCIAGCST